MIKNNRPDPIDTLKERCQTLNESISKNLGWIIMLRKARGKNSEPADLDLIYFKGKVNNKINNIIGMIDRQLDKFNVED